jgi:4-amino-4-deoxy-L-arabinose transferase-like glycosyltransferase
LKTALASRRIPLALAAAAAAIYLVAAAGRDFWSPDEPDFAEHVREMLGRKSLLLPYENGKPYSEKPILFYWAMAATTPLSGGDVHPLALRLPSVLAGAALVFCAAWFAGRRGGSREALVAGAATAVAPIVFWQAQYVQVDALFSCLLMCALVSLYFLERESGGEEAVSSRWVLRVSLALAVLTKGPLAVVLVGLVAVTRCVFARSMRLLRNVHLFQSIFVFLLLVVPWYFFAARAGGSTYAYDLVVNQNWNRFFEAFDHVQPWWFYLESIWSDFFPWTALVLLSAFVLARAGLFRAREDLGFAATVAAVCVVFLSISQAKQGKYLLVAYPFAAILVAALVSEAERRAAEGRLLVLRAVRGWVAIAAIVLIAGAVALVLAARRLAPGHAGLAPVVASVVVAGAAVTLVALARRRDAVPALLALAGAMAAGELAAGAVVFPAIDVLKTGRPFYERLRPRVSHGEPLAYFGGTYRCYPILVLRRFTEHFRTDRALADWVERTPGALVLADESERRHWTDGRLASLVVLDRQPVGGDEALLLGRP